MDGEGNAGDRRERRERREGVQPDEATSGRRGAKKRGTSPLMYVLQALGSVVVLIAVIVFAVRSMHPVYATRGTLGDELRKHAPGAAAAIGAGDSTNVDKLMATEKFQQEKRNFFEDVMRLKQVDSARADTIAQYAVREAYVRGISPAIIFGVMLTENSKFVSKAQSNVGAVGLMQVYPKVWLTKEMTKLFGRDLASDSTNVKYGVFILSHYFNPQNKNGTTTPQNWATALLHYNGCVHGTNTPRCHTYPNKVQTFVEQQATSICAGRSFYDCIAKPFIDGLFKGGKLAPDDSTHEVVATAAAIAADSVKGATAVAAGEVSGPAPPPIELAPVVVRTPDSTAVPASTASVPAAAVPPAVAAAAVAPKVSSSKGSASSRKSGRSVATTSKKAAPKRAAVKKAAARKSAPKKAAAKPVHHSAPMPKAPKPITIKVP